VIDLDDITTARGTEMLLPIEDTEKGTAAVVEIISNMSEEKSANGSGSLSILRDSMQEITAALGNIRSQIEARDRAGRAAECSDTRWSPSRCVRLEWSRLSADPRRRRRLLGRVGHAIFGAHA
jgi:hypothetical protein